MTLTDAEYAYLRSELGEADRTDLESRYQRLGSVQAVAVEVLRERKEALERQIAALEEVSPNESVFAAPVPMLRRRSR